MSTRSLNKVMLIGNLTRDPELRYTGSGTPVATFGLATNRSWAPSDGSERKEEVQFHRIVAWSKLAEICEQLLFKGRKVYIEGRLQTRKWTTQEGQERETAEIVADTMMILDTRQRDGSAPAPRDSGGDRDGRGSDDWVNVAAGSDEETIQVEEEKPKKTAKKTAKKAVKKEAPAEDIVNVDDIPF